MDKKNRPYKVVPYDPAWAKMYEKERKMIASIFQEKALAIEHIGSTSVEGMWAKPQIDILVIVGNLHDVDNLITQMELQGYTYQSDFEKYNERYFTRDTSSGERLVSVHVMQENHPQASSHIYLRDYLREYPQERDLYSQVKKEAYKDEVNRAEYPKRKKKILTTLLERAREWSEEKKLS